MPVPESPSFHRVDRMRAHIREHVGPDQAFGIEIPNLIRMIANQYETLGEQTGQRMTLSGPRWGVLLRLMVEEKRGRAYITPTSLSQGQNVSKNTISALLRGLEEQGLIARELDETDRRIFRIRLTPAGRELVEKAAPQHLQRLNQLISGLSMEEKSQLSDLLAKLYCSMTTASCSTEAQ